MITKLTKKLFKNRDSLSIILPKKWLERMFLEKDIKNVNLEFKKNKIIITRCKHENTK